jgi:hypothetical protein
MPGARIQEFALRSQADDRSDSEPLIARPITKSPEVIVTETLYGAVFKDTASIGATRCNRNRTPKH